MIDMDKTLLRSDMGFGRIKRELSYFSDSIMIIISLASKESNKFTRLQIAAVAGHAALLLFLGLHTTLSYVLLRTLT
ncbi:hypothetical protein JCM10914A_01500 [Paenibacillus sp. JCM 10914]